MRDVLTGEEFDIKAKCVVNATGPFTDGVRKMDDPMETNICQPSAGVHIVLPDYYRFVMRKFCNSFQYYITIQLNCFHLNGHTLGCHPQT